MLFIGIITFIDNILVKFRKQLTDSDAKESKCLVLDNDNVPIDPMAV